MSTEVNLHAFASPMGREDDFGAGPHDLDPVLVTAADRPDESSIAPALDPTLDHLDPASSQRRDEVDEKHRRVSAFLDRHDYQGVVLTRADSLSWFTGGGELNLDLGTEAGSIALFLNRTTRAVLADNVESPRVFEEELAGLGFQLKERPWHADESKLVAELTRGRRFACDDARWGLIPEEERLRGLRSPLLSTERERLRTLGRSLALAIEATCRNFLPGETEADVAGHLAHRLFREGMVPVDIRVAGDGRLERFRRPSFKNVPIRQRATISAVARRSGLCASATRTVSFGPAGDHVRDCHTVASLVDATCIYFSRPGEPVAEVFRRARRIYEKFDHPHEWNLDHQGHRIGYASREGLLLPDDPAPFEAGTAVCWSPSVGPARSSDTVVIDSRGFEVVTEAQAWPKIAVSVKGFNIDRPAILER